MPQLRNIKLVAIGDDGVGKTALLSAYTTNSFPTARLPSRFPGYAANLIVDKEIINLSIWDTAGQADYESLHSGSEFRDTDIFLVCFSVISPRSYENVLAKWYPELVLASPSSLSSCFPSFLLVLVFSFLLPAPAPPLSSLIVCGS